VIVVLTGVSGSGKTTIGALLAEALNCRFVDADALHSEQNIDKMRQRTPLTDVDRAPWLAAINAVMLESVDRDEDLVVGCSALKQRYRTQLAQGVSITWVYLRGSVELIRTRLMRRSDHFMVADMLASQFDALEEPSDAFVVDVSAPATAIVQSILAHLRAPRRSGRPA
jgi:gluconokinase